MYADAVTTVVLEVQSNPKAQKGQLKLSHWHFYFFLLSYTHLKQSTYIVEYFEIGDPLCVAQAVMETQSATMDMDVFQTRLEVMLQ